MLEVLGKSWGEWVGEWMGGRRDVGSVGDWGVGTLRTTIAFGTMQMMELHILRSEPPVMGHDLFTREGRRHTALMRGGNMKQQRRGVV